MKESPKIVIASDSFKGSLTSSQVADAVSEGIRQVFPHAEIIRANIADGGEGTTAAILDSVENETVTLYVHDPLGRRIEAVYGLADGGGTAIIEAAAASGLTLLTEDEKNPLLTSTYGTGEMIADALRRGCRKFMIGLGGSATNDGGMGMLSALGYRFLDSHGNPLDGCGASLKHVSSIDDSGLIPGIHESEFIVACDVDNPLYGPQGAACVFAPQKGADRFMVQELDEGLRNFSFKIKEYCNKDVSSRPGAGAAGGLGAAFMAFLNGRPVSGIEMILDLVHFDEMISGADLVITGEGSIDEQTAMGKVPVGVLKRAVRQGITTIALGGVVRRCESVGVLGFDRLIQVTPAGMALDSAMQPETAKRNIIDSVAAYLSSEHQPVY